MSRMRGAIGKIPPSHIVHLAIPATNFLADAITSSIRAFLVVCFYFLIYCSWGLYLGLRPRTHLTNGHRNDITNINGESENSVRTEVIFWVKET